MRAVAPPYPGAFCTAAGRTLRLLRTFSTGERDATTGSPALLARDSELHLRCADGGVLHVLQAELGGAPFDAAAMRSALSAQCVPIQSAMVTS